MSGVILVLNITTMLFAVSLIKTFQMGETMSTGLLFAPYLRDVTAHKQTKPEAFGTPLLEINGHGWPDCTAQFTPRAKHIVLGGP